MVKGERVHQFLDNEAEVLDVVYNPDGSSFYSISGAGDLTRWEMHPEIFVTRYFYKPYNEELSTDPVFEPRRKGESKKEFQARETEAGKAKAKIIDKYYHRYLEERGN